MECPVHPSAEIIGYCSVCGTFGCSDCLTQHEGNLLCARHYRPIAKELEEEKKHEEIRKKYPRQRLVVHYRSKGDVVGQEARSVSGVCFALNLKEDGFHLDLVDASGASLEKTVYVAFSEIKAVFLVKSFDGKFDKHLRYDAWAAEGEELVIKFKDGEVIQGRSLRPYNPDVPRFHIVPSSTEGNNISILIERTATEAIYTGEEYRAKIAREREMAKEEGAPANLSQEETMGDFYFQMRNYSAAAAQYRLAAAKYPQAHRPQKKLLAAQYNMGVEHIKHHEYTKALALMEFVLKANPENERVEKKVLQLRHIIEKAGKPRTPSAE